jgi:hypothetical protein
MIAIKEFECMKCLSNFSSRNKLFKHIQICGSNNPIDIIVCLSNMTNFSIYDAYIYVLGGRIRGKTLGSTERFNVISKKWEICAPMLENRGSHCTVAVGSNIYVFGGGGFTYAVGSNCEMYDSISNKWESISPMKTCRHALSVTAVDNKIYVVGGWENGSKCSHAIECYDIMTNSWTICSPMPTARRLVGVTTFNSNIYAFGGNRDDPLWYTSCAEVYDPVSTISFNLLNNYCVYYFIMYMCECFDVDEGYMVEVT